MRFGEGSYQGNLKFFVWQRVSAFGLPPWSFGKFSIAYRWRRATSDVVWHNFFNNNGNLMRFNQLDRIVELVPGQRLRAIKCVTLAEQHLQDHFPLFPVMPGVLMLEALSQAASWLIRVTDDFQYSMVVLREARNIKFQDFVAPGDRLEVAVEIFKVEGSLVHLKAVGMLGERTAVNGRLVMEKFTLADRNGEDVAVDRNVSSGHRHTFRRLAQSLPLAT